MSDRDAFASGDSTLNESLDAGGLGDLSPSTAGSLLRQAREAAGLHISVLAGSLKVPVNKLEALEQGRFDLLPDVVFARALAASVCRTLKVDSSLILDRLPHTDRHTLTYPTAAVNTPFRPPRDRAGSSVWMRLPRPAVLGGVLLLVAASALYFYPGLKARLDEVKLGGDAAAVKLGEEHITSSGDRSDALQGGSPAASPGPPAFALGSNTNLAPSAAFSTTPPLTEASPGVLVAPTPASINRLATASNPAVSGEVISITAQGSSWVEVTDARGQVVLRRTLSAGEVALASGALPLRAVVGRADSTQVLIRGKAFDLTASTKNNVARFEVK